MASTHSAPVDDLRGVRRWDDHDDHSFLLRLEPTDDMLANDLDAASAWVKDNKEALDSLLMRHGAIRFRGFPIADPEGFAQFLSAYDGFGSGYSGGTSPRGVVTGRVMEATVAPADRVVPVHQEMAYSTTYPLKLAFFCEVAASSGGETPACDMRKLQQLLPRRLFDNVRERGLLYFRHFREPDYKTGIHELDIVHRTWQDTFGTDDRSVAENQVAAMGSDFRWDDTGIFVSNPTRGFVTHPQGGDDVWFNSIGGYGFSDAVLGEKMGRLYAEHYGPDRPLPYWVTYGDGEPIDLADIAPLYPATDEASVAIPWEAGEVMLLDNIYAGHGRSTFAGERKVRVMLLD